MDLSTKKVLLISYHAYSKGSYRPTILHRYFSERADRGEIAAYKFLCSDFDHMAKSRRHKSASEPRVEPLWVPTYIYNLSFRRIWSHLVFSLQLFFRKELCQADLIVVCVPPSFTAVPALMYARFRGKHCVLDLVDLWPEALPASPRRKALLMHTVGWIWVLGRNFFYRQSSLLLSHCQFFLTQLDRKDCPRSMYLPLSQLDAEIFAAQPNRASLKKELRILVLGSINHVLDIESLTCVLEDLSRQVRGQHLVLEIIGSGESKPQLLRNLRKRTPDVEVLDHGQVFDVPRKTKILMRCHFGYNGYKNTSAIGITYKSIDFASAGLLFINSVQGDLVELVSSYGVGFNYRQTEEAILASKILALSDEDFEAKSSASRQMALDHFHPDRFEHDFTQALSKLSEPLP